MEKIFAYARWKEVLGLVLIILMGLLVRLEDIRDWKAHPERAMYKGEPLLTTFDGYYYLTLARDLARGTYGHIDYRRAVPDYPKMPWPPPLLSVIGAGVHKITGISFNWIGAVLPAVLGMFIVMPLYLMARFYGGPLMGFIGSLVGVLSFYFIYRSSLGWFDTDCMNVTWALAASYLFLKFGVERGISRYLYCAGGGVIWFLFMWWWDQTPYVATVLALLPFVISIIFFYRPNRKEGLVFLGTLLALSLVVIAWKGVDFPIKVFQKVLSQYEYISKEISPDFPNIGVSISEQAKASFGELVAKTTDSYVVFFISIVGLSLLFFKRPKDSLFLSVPVVLSIFSYLFAKRFLIFLAPITAMGAGFFIAFFWKRASNFKLVRPFLILLIFGFLSPSFFQAMNKTFWPKEPPHLVDGMVYAGKHTPKDAVIWAWWDHGYPLIYFSDRGTINDGSAHSPERSVYNGIPLATHDQRFSANFMRFYVATGLNGISKLYRALNGDKAKAMELMKKVLSAGPQEGLEIIKSANLKSVDNLNSPKAWLRYFFPKKARPVYLFLDWRLTVTSYWWFWLGTWDIKKHDGKHPSYATFYNVISKGQYIKGPGLSVDTYSGTALFRGRRLPLKEITVLSHGRIMKKEYPNRSNLVFDYYERAKFGAIMDQNISKSVFNVLFMRRQANLKYFRPIRLATPSHQIWEVKGDTF